MVNKNINWKEHYDTIKVGDMVELVQYDIWEDICNPRCCNTRGYYIGKTYKVFCISGIHYYLESLNINYQNCPFPKQCIKKVFK